MKNKQTILLIIPLIILIFLVIGVTYAYYELNSTGESSTTIVVGGATISANYLISNDITLEDLIPSNDVATYKDIKITYNNTSNEVHKIYLKAKIDYNTFTDTENDGVLYYDIYSGTNHDTLKQEKKLFPTIEYGKSILYEIEIPASSQGNENYRINFYFPKSDKVQNKNGQLILNSSIILEENDSLEYTNNFETDSWGAIAAVINHRDPSVYKVGDEKEVEIDNKSYTVRVANNSTPDECKEADFSETACGFVVEFVDIIEERKMNSTNTSVGGWPASEIRRYANGEFFKKLPSDLQKVIISTKTISGHGTSENSNLISYDMIYLLSTREVFIDEESRPVSTYDTGYDNTRQLDYYKSLGTNSSNYNGTIKKYNEEAKNWWLRSANKPYSDGFLYVRLDGIWTAVRADVTSIYFAPAFRIGDTTKNIQDTYEFGYTGTEQTFIVPVSGTYKIEAWGASGNNNYNDYTKNNASYAAYTSGNIAINKGTKLYIYVGGQKEVFNCCTKQGNNAGSGGATDIRLISGNWNNSQSLASRIMVAGGAGGAYTDGSAPGGGSAGGLTSYAINTDAHAVYSSNQTAGGKASTNGTAGGFGYGGVNSTSHYNSGAGGYFGGGSGPAGGGGSSYISGHTGCVAVKSQTDLSAKSGCTTGTSDNNCSIHYSTKKFTNTVMIDGKGYSWTNTKGALQLMPKPTGGYYNSGIGNEGNGYARITYIQ